MSESRRPARRSSEAGSAYVIALLVLVVLSIAGLSLVLITGTEATIGTAERSLNRTFYAADSGVAVGLTNLLNRSYQPMRFTTAGFEPSAINKTDRVDVSCIFPLRMYFCNLCTANAGSSFFNINHTYLSTATRYGLGQPLAQQQLVVSLQIEPSQMPPASEDCADSLGRALLSTQIDEHQQGNEWNPPPVEEGEGEGEGGGSP